MSFHDKERHRMDSTFSTPHYYDGPADSRDDIQLEQRYFAYRTEGGIVAGCDFNVSFTIDRPTTQVWPYFKDFNLWQNSYGHFYSGVLGALYSRPTLELGAESFRIGDKPNDEGPHQYRILRVIPERTIVIYQPVPPDGTTSGVSPGFHVFMLLRHGNTSLVTGLMEHALRTQDESEEQALAFWRKETPEWQRKWRDIFIPNLKKLVYENT